MLTEPPNSFLPTPWVTVPVLADGGEKIAGIRAFDAFVETMTTPTPARTR
ncbi:hypothetical protein [Sphaerisporangium sp. TRM90804]|nr:hypothetical protein [Sphaerisporangium sp. TRM90804]MDH2425397.1 hypothetical protein [Sphaerisporangium sp. TRM90804]